MSYFVALACQCAKQNNYSPPITLTFTEYGLGEQSTIYSYDFNNIHYYCVYDVSISTTEVNIIIYIFISFRVMAK